jgi:DNA-binding FadR family transcriptional regulator
VADAAAEAPVVCGFVLGPSWSDARRGDKLAERLARQIIEDIVGDGLRSGDLLGSEAHLAERYGIGRASLREALRLLELQGVVVPKRGAGGGLLVGEASSREFARIAKLHLHARGATYGEVTDARTLLEPMLARAAAELAAPERLAELRTVLDEARAVGPHDDLGFQRAAAQFHVVVARLAGNSILDLIGSLVQEVHEAQQVVSTSPARKAAALVVHEAIAEAIAAGDGDRAEALMREHTRDTGRTYASSSHRGERIRWS